LFGRGQMDLLFGSSSAHRHPPLYHRSYHTDGIYSTYLWDITLYATTEVSTLETLLLSRPEDGALLRMLVDHGILVPSSNKKRQTLQASCNRSGAGCCSGAASLYLLLSQTCNMACVYCLAGKESYGANKPAYMSERIAQRAIERCLDAVGPGGRLEIVFFGGEPMLGWPLAQQIMVWCENELCTRFTDRTWRFHLTTNLSICPPELVELAKHYGIAFLVDVDGPPEIHDALRPIKGGGSSHHLISHNVERLCRAGLHISLRATVTSLNVDRMLEVTRHHRDLGADGSAFVAVNPVDSDERILPSYLYPDPLRFAEGLRESLIHGGWRPEQLYPFSEYLPRVRATERMTQACGAPYGNTPVVDSLGDVYPCIYWVGIPRLRLGNVFDRNRYANEGLLNNLRERLHVDRLPRCRVCHWRYLCGGGCPVKRIILEEHPFASPEALRYADEITCITSTTVLEELLWHEAEERANSRMEEYANVQV